MTMIFIQSVWCFKMNVKHNEKNDDSSVSSKHSNKRTTINDYYCHSCCCFESKCNSNSERNCTSLTCEDKQKKIIRIPSMSVNESADESRVTLNHKLWIADFFKRVVQRPQIHLHLHWDGLTYECFIHDRMFGFNWSHSKADRSRTDTQRREKNNGRHVRNIFTSLRILVWASCGASVRADGSYANAVV